MQLNLSRLAKCGKILFDNFTALGGLIRAYNLLTLSVFVSYALIKEGKGGSLTTNKN